MKNTTPEQLLNDIYNQVDLKDDVFEYVNGYILKAYQLLKRKSRGDEVFANVDDSRKLENILNIELPDLVDAYKKMPLEYRNTKKLKNGKTPRELLINSLHMLTHSIQEIENNANHNGDLELAVKNRSIREKYQVDTLTQTESEYHNTFYWDNYAQNLPGMNVDFFEKEQNHSGQTIEIVDGEIKYKTSLSEKIKTTFNTGIAKSIKAKNKIVKYLRKNFFVFFPLIILVMTIGVVWLAMFSIDYFIDYKYQYAQNMSNVLHIVEGYQENENAQTEKAMELVLNQYMTKHPEAIISYKRINENTLKSLLLTEHMTSSRCEDTLDRLSHKFSSFDYVINGHALNIKSNLESDSIKSLCVLKDNVIESEFIINKDSLSDNIHNVFNIVNDFNQTPTQSMKKITLGVLENYHLQHPETTINYDKKQNSVTVIQKVSSSDCENVIKTISSSFSSLDYTLNDNSFNVKNGLSPEIISALCAPSLNTITTVFDL